MTSVEPESGCLAESLHFQNHFIILNKLFGFYFMMFLMSLLLLQDFGRFLAENFNQEFLDCCLSDDKYCRKRPWFACNHL